MKFIIVGSGGVGGYFGGKLAHSGEDYVLVRPSSERSRVDRNLVVLSWLMIKLLNV